MVVDYRNLLILWVEEMVARQELSLKEADEMLQKQEVQEKLWTGPIKDSAGNFRILQKLSED